MPGCIRIKNNYSTRVFFQSIPATCLPCLAWLDDQPVILIRIAAEWVEYVSFADEAEKNVLSADQFQSRSRQYVYLLSSELADDDRDPDFEPYWHQHWLWGSLLEAKKVYREIVLVSLLINMFALAVPLFVRLIYDRVIPGMAMTTLNTLTLGIFLVIGFELICRQLRTRFIDLAAKKADLLVSGRIFAKVMSMRMESRPEAVGAFARQVQDFETIREFLTSTTLTSLVDLPFALIFLLVIGLMGGELVWIPIITIVFVVLISLLIQPALRRTIEESEKLSARKNGDLVESLTGMESLRLAGAQWYFQKRWEQAIGHMATWNLKTRRITGGISVVAVWVQQITTIAVVYFGVLAISSSAINLGALIAVMMLAGRAIAPFMQLALLSTRYHQAKTSYHVIDRLMSAPDEQKKNHPYRKLDSLSGVIDCNQLSYTYPGASFAAINEFSVGVESGEKLAIVGRSGSGKSTLAKILAALCFPDEGLVLFDGIDQGDIHPSFLRQNIGFLSQEPWLFHGTVRENITLGSAEVDEGILMGVARSAGVTTFTGESLASLDYPVGEGGRKLSGGQKRSVALARALLRQPKILILDEPTVYMDSFLEERVRQTLLNLPASTTLLLMTHKRSLLSAVDRVIVLDEGKAVSDRAVKEILGDSDD